MFIANLNTLSDFARGVDALIGVDLMQLNNLTFDYNTRRVLFGPIDHNIQGTQMRPPTRFTVRVQVQGHPIDLSAVPILKDLGSRQKKASAPGRCAG